MEQINENLKSDEQHILNTGINLYDLNKQLIENLPDLSDEKIEEKKDVIRKFVRSAHYNNRFFMLLGRDLGYYTLFNRVLSENTSHPRLQDEVIECVKELGTIKSIDKIKEDAIEFWIKNDNGIFVLMLFPYDRGVIICQ